jgi:hypothetical protein
MIVISDRGGTVTIPNQLSDQNSDTLILTSILELRQLR